MNEMVYNKEYHFLDSVSVWLDLDSLVYILVILFLAFGVTNLILKLRKKKLINLLVFTKNFMVLCAIPVFVLFGVQLIMSGMFIIGNIIITFLPLIYAVIIQLICMLVYKIIKK